MGFIVVFIGGPAAAYKSEGGICGEDDDWIVYSSEVSKLYTFEIVISLKVKCVSQNAPFGTSHDPTNYHT